MSLFFLLPASGIKGAFDISSIDGTVQANDEDGQTVTGNIQVTIVGAVDWTGDIFGTTESDDWWLPNGTVSGTWHVRLSYSSGDPIYSSGSGLGTWLELSSNRTWNFSKASVGGPDTDSGDYTLAFSDDAGSTTHDSVTITINLNEQAP